MCVYDTRRTNVLISLPHCPKLALALELPVGNYAMFSFEKNESMCVGSGLISGQWARKFCVLWHSVIGYDG